MTLAKKKRKSPLAADMLRLRDDFQRAELNALEASRVGDVEGAFSLLANAVRRVSAELNVLAGRVERYGE